jgi:hypothetical protein
MSLRAGDLRHLVKRVFTIDSYQSKIGDDEDVVVLGFEVQEQEAAKDVENFVEMGYDYVLDADVTPGETDSGNFVVFVELERTRHVAEQILEIIEGIKKLSNLDYMRFRYFKSFKSKEATEENLKAAVPIDRNGYHTATEKNKLDNFSEFFSNSFADDIKLIDESITFKRTYSDPITFNVINSGPKEDIYESMKGPIMLQNKDMAEVMFLTRHIGNYNIVKINDQFIFERNNWAVCMERK